MKVKARWPGGGDSASSDVQIETVGRSDTGAISAAIALADHGKGTLGYLPHAVYEEAATRGELIVAKDLSQDTIGFALFELTTRWIRLKQLYVDPRIRRRGVAGQLVDWISHNHHDRAGILVWCRLDYNLGPMWLSLGFRRGGEKRGRGKEPRVLVSWWRDHGHPALFTHGHEGAIVRASIDLNFIRDLVDDRRPDRVESLAIEGDQFADRLDLVRTTALDLEVESMTGDIGNLCRRRLLDFPAISPARDRVDRLFLELASIAQRRNGTFAALPQSQMDILYIAEAIAAELDAFVTRDQLLAEVLGDAASEHGLRILRPSEILVRIDELVRANAYRPGAIGSTEYTRRAVPAGREDRFDGFVGRTSGERLPAFRTRLRSLAQRHVERIGWFDPDGLMVALYARVLVAPTLDVPMLRVREGPTAATLVRQILFTLREDAVTQRAAVIRLSDPHIARESAVAAAEDGFVISRGTWIGLVIDVAGSASAVSRVAVEAAVAASIQPPPSATTNAPPIVAAEIERSWWPAKLIDSRLPTVLIPIQQRFSRDLLGAPLGLFARPATLGLSREHVYYRSPRGPKLTAPARLLWYMSGSSGGSVEPAGVVASSLLEEVVEGPPDDLHRRFQHLGVWQFDEIVATARNGTAQALRFTHTEQFGRPVPRSTVVRLVGSVPQGPRAIPSDAFSKLYAAGHGHA